MAQRQDGEPKPEEALPFISTDALFIRRVQIDFGENAELRRELRNAIRKKLTISLGPIFISGIVNDRHFIPVGHKTGLNPMFVQFIGWYIYRTPKSPNPLGSSFTWP
jgi:hypothetical protein